MYTPLKNSLRLKLESYIKQSRIEEEEVIMEILKELS
jgi:hypothetical protein